MRRNVKCELCGKMKNSFVCSDCSEREGLKWVEKTKKDVDFAYRKGIISQKEKDLQILDDWLKENQLDYDCYKERNEKLKQKIKSK